MPHNKGQTLLEAIVALGVLVVGFLGILTLLARSFAVVRNASAETTATYLAAEGIELTKNILDHAMYAYPNLGPSEAWPCFPTIPGNYGFDYTVLTSPANLCASLATQQNQNQVLLLDAATGLYGYTATATTAPSNFTRTISVTPVAGNQYELMIDVTVTWNGGASNVVLEDHFYDWLPGA